MKKKQYLVPLCEAINYAPTNLADGSQFTISDESLSSEDYEEYDISQENHWGDQW